MIFQQWKAKGWSLLEMKHFSHNKYWVRLHFFILIKDCHCHWDYMVFLDRNYIYYVLNVYFILFAIKLELSKPLLITLSEVGLSLKWWMLAITDMGKTRITQLNPFLNLCKKPECPADRNEKLGVSTMESQHPITSWGHLLGKVSETRTAYTPSTSSPTVPSEY